MTSFPHSCRLIAFATFYEVIFELLVQKTDLTPFPALRNNTAGNRGRKDLQPFTLLQIFDF